MEENNETKQPDEDNYESDSSADSSGEEKCPICLLSFASDQEIGKPAVCDHSFCFPCIQEWSKVVQTCPIDRKEFKEIKVFGNLESTELLRTVAIKEKVKFEEFTVTEELTACEICENTDREDCMLLCDGCDKGFHMDCLDPPLLEIPQGNWYCDECFSSSDESDEEDDEEEVGDLINDAEEVIGELPENRLRTRQQPQILRTSQSERIRNAIVARMSLRGTREAFGEGPSTSAAVTRRPVRRRRATRRRATRRRTKTVVVEYDVDGSDKFAMRKKRVPVRRRKGRRKKRKVARRKPARTSKPTAGPSTSFKGVNSNVHDLQRGRQHAGISNFNIFEPTNMLDYVPDEDNIDDSGIEIGDGNVLTQAIIGLNNPQRRNMMIKNRVLQNCTTTSSSVDLLGSIMQDQDMFGPGSITKRFAVEKSSGKLVFKGEGVKKSSDGNGSNGNGNEQKSETTSPPESLPPQETPVQNSEPPQQEVNRSSDDPEESQNLPTETFDHDTKKKPKKPEIDMFDENPEKSTTEDCPIFSIYDSVNVMVDQENSSSFLNRQAYDEENVDLVQMSDAEEAPSAIIASQPASPDVEIDKVGERSYTPPIAMKTSDDAPDRDDEDSDKRKKEQKKNRKRESSVKRYSVRDRLKDRSPARLKDKFGRNRSRSSSRKKQSRRRSRSRSYRRSRSPEKLRRSPEKLRRSPEKLRRSPTRSRSRRRTPSIEYDRKKRNNKKKSGRRSRSRSLTPRLHRATTPERKNRSKSKKAKRKKHRDYSKEKPSTLTKEVFTSGQNILVSVNFNNQDEKLIEDREPKEIVDITARKKITVSSKPVAIIDLARSPFRELTPEYQTNVIELSDSEGERSNEKNPPKSPDSSSKLYDPFDILNSPTNENVTSSQNAAAVNLAKLTEKISEPAKINASYNKNVMAMATGANLFSSFEENLVSSSSQPQLIAAKIDEKNASKNEVVPMDIAESPYSPGHDYDDSFQHDDGDVGGAGRGSKAANKASNIFEDLFGSTTPPGLDKFKNSGKKNLSGDKNIESNKYLMKMKRQERVVEEVKLVIKPYYSKRTITKEQYKEILRKAVPKICHSREINPQKIKILIDSYVKIFKHRKKPSGVDESF